MSSVLELIPVRFFALVTSANVNTTATSYIRTAADNVRDAMLKLPENNVPALKSLTDTFGTQDWHLHTVPAPANCREIMGLGRTGPVAQMDRAAVS
jgi:hypothetical protein